jgi:hypothetical protein
MPPRFSLILLQMTVYMPDYRSIVAALALIDENVGVVRLPAQFCAFGLYKRCMQVVVTPHNGSIYSQEQVNRQGDTVKKSPRKLTSGKMFVEACWSPSSCCGLQPCSEL